MSLNLNNFENNAHEAIKTFWGNRESARQNQLSSGRKDQGERAGVTAGKNMDGFVSLILDIVRSNGLAHADIHTSRALLTLPGFFRPTKLWDLLIMYKGELIVAIELKSHVGPSFGNNFNNRVEESIGTALDFWTALREGAFGKQPSPFVGWLMLVEDAPESRRTIQERTLTYPVFEEFKASSYLARYDLLCQRMMREQLYTAAAVITSERSAINNGAYTELSPMTGLWSFATTLAGHVASAALRLG